MGLTRITSDGITDGTISTADLADQSVTLAKLPHGTSSNNGKFLRANNGADPTFETINSFGTGSLVGDQSPQLGGDLDTNSNDIKFADNDKALFGANSDLRIYHDGSNSYITDLGTGDLNINGDDINILTNNNGEYAARFIENGTVILYNDGSEKFRTNSTGVKVSSSANAEIKIVSATSGGATLEFGDTDNDDEANISYDNYNGFMMYRTTADADMRFYTNGTHRLTLHKTGYLAPAADSTYDIGTSSVRFANGYFDTLYGDGSNLTGISSDLLNDTSPQLGGDLDVNSNDILLGDNGELKVGAGTDLRHYHFSNNNWLNVVNGSLYFARSGSAKILFDTNGDLGFYDSQKAYFGDSADLQIYHDGTENRVASASGVNHRITTDQLIVNNAANNEEMFKAIGNGACELYYDATKKFETSSTGVSVTGALVATGDVTAFSDARLKTDIHTINNALGIVGKLRGVSYKWLKDGKPSIGVIAQEVEEVIPEVVLTTQHEDKEVKSVDYGKIVGVLINAINELKTEIDELKGGK